MLVGIIVPNLVKLFSVSTKLLGVMPTYLQWVGRDPAVLEDENTRGRLRSAFTEIFFSIQTHALNVAACALLGWIVWRGRLPALSPWLRGLASGVSIAAGVSNLIIASHLIGEFSRVHGAGRAARQLEEHLGIAEDQRMRSFTVAEVIQAGAGIGIYVVSAVACAGLAYLMWS
jgi:hypothetical protein